MASITEKFMPPHRLRELDKLCMKISCFALFFADVADESALHELAESFPDPDRFFDGPPNVGDAKNYMMATLKAALLVMMEK